MPEVNERWEGRGDFTPGERGTRLFDVLFADGEEVGEGPAVDAVTAAGYGQGSTHPWDARLLARAPTANYEGPRVLLVSVEHAPKDPRDGSLPLPENPLDYPPLWSCSPAISVERTERSYDGYPLVNSVGDLFDDCTDELVETVYTRRRNVSTFDINFALAHLRAVNSAPIRVPGGNASRYTVPPLWAKVVHFAPSGEFVEGAPFVEEILQIAIRVPVSAFEASGQMSPWDHRRLDIGPNGRSNYGVGPWVNAMGDRLTLRMDGRGRPLDTSQDPKVGVHGKARYIDGQQPAGSILEQTADGVFIWFRKCKRMNFGGLGL